MLTRLLSPEQLDGVQVGDDAIALLGLGEEIVEVNVTPGPRLLLLDARPGPRVLALAGHPRRRLPRPRAAVASPTATDDGYAVRLADDAPIDGQDGCDRFVARIVRGIDPTRPSPPWMQHAADADGHAARSRSPST